MGRNFFTDKFKALNAKSSRFSGVSLTALGILGFAGTASAQDVELDTKPILEDIYSTTDEDGIHSVSYTHLTLPTKA